MLSKQPWPNSPHNPKAEFLQQNAEELASIELFAELSVGFTIAFVEVNSERDRQTVIEYLKNSDRFPKVQWISMVLANQNLQYFGSEACEQLQAKKLRPDRQPVLLISGLESSIKAFGEYPAVLSNLNMERDSYPRLLPYPIVLLLPSYAITRCARYAPDFWSWKSIDVRLQSTLPDPKQNLVDQPIPIAPTTVLPTPQSRFDLLQRLLAASPEPTVNRARLLKQLGDAHSSIYENAQAAEAYQSALDIYNGLPASLDRAKTIDGLAKLYNLQGKFSAAFQLWQQALAIQREIGDRQGEAASLHQLSMIYYQLGDYLQALSFSEQSIEIYREIGDRQGEAASLAQMAMIAYKQGDQARGRELRLQAAVIRGSIGDYGGLIIDLWNLGADVPDAPDVLGFLAQSLWLTVHCATNLKNAINLIATIYQQVPAGDGLEPLLAATARYFCHTRSHPELPQLTEFSYQLLTHAAQQRGIEDLADIEQWLVAEQLQDPAYFLPALLHSLEAIIGEGWLFDRAAFQTQSSSSVP